MRKAPMTIRELRVMMELVKAGAERSVGELGGDPNPQVVKMRDKAQAELDLADAVLRAMGGDRVALRIFARDFDPAAI